MIQQFGRTKVVRHIKFLPSYVGSKSFWVNKLQKYKGRNFVELFCGSAVLSVNLAGTCVLNDKDPYIYNVLSRFDELIVPESFSPNEYFKYRTNKDWWRYVYYLAKMSYSGVFRYSKNGWNVPIKDKNKSYSLNKEYQTALSKWLELRPFVLQNDYTECNSFITLDSVLVLDPPYENTVASYVVNSNFDYHKYWEYVRLNENICKAIILFDFVRNLPFPTNQTRKSRANGARTGNLEGMFIFEDQLREGQAGEDLFFSLNEPKLKRLDGILADFELLDGRKLELKSDYYDETRTENFFFERWSDDVAKKDGGPWQALNNGAELFCYFYVKNKKLYVFNTEKLVEFLNNAVGQYELIGIPNKTWITSGYKVPRSILKNLVIQEKQYE